MADKLEYRIGRFVLTPVRQLLDKGAPVLIGRKALQVLSALAKAEGGLVTKDELMAAVWPNAIVEDNAIQVHITALRKVLGEESERLITVHGLGYRLAVTDESDPSDSPRAPSRAGPVAALARGSVPPHWRLPALGLVVFALAVAGYVWFKNASGEARAAKPPTIAVLAFQPADGGPDARLYADGLASSIATALSRYNVTVIASTSSLQLATAQKPQARALLGADFVVDGQIASNHDKITVTTQISDTRQNILVSSFDLAGDTGLSSALADRIATHLALTLDPTKFLTNDATPRFTAADYALLARINSAIDDGDLSANMEASRQLAERYPDDGELQAAAGVPIIFAIPYLPASQRTPLLQTARADVERGSRLAPRSGPVHFARSLLMHGPLSLAPEERLLQQSLQLDPTLGPSINALGGVMLSVGRSDEGIALIRRSIQVNPLSAVINWDAVRCYINAGRDADAAQGLARQEALWPNTDDIPDLKRLMANYLGTPQDVLSVAKTYPLRMDLLGVIQADADLLLRAEITRDKSLIRQSINNCFETFGKNVQGFWDERCLFMMVRVGALDDAFRFAERVYPDTRALYPMDDDRWLTAPPPSHDTARLFGSRMNAFRNDPRFWPVAVRTGLVNYWQTTQEWPDFCRGQIDMCKARAAHAIGNNSAVRVALLK